MTRRSAGDCKVDSTCLRSAKAVSSVPLVNVSSTEAAVISMVRSELDREKLRNDLSAKVVGRTLRVFQAVLLTRMIICVQSKSS